MALYHGYLEKVVKNKPQYSLEKVVNPKVTKLMLTKYLTFGMMHSDHPGHIPDINTEHILLRQVHNTKQVLALCCVSHALMLLAVQCNARIESNPIHVFPCIAFMRLVAKIEAHYLRELRT